jgi:hypothetical protein
MRASVDPHLAGDPSVECVFGNAKRHMGHSEFEDSSRPGKRQRLHVDPDRPLLSSEREVLQSSGQNRQKIEPDFTVIPNSQRMEVDKAKCNGVNNQPLGEPAFLSGASSSGLDVNQRREQPNSITKRNTSRFETPAERRRSASIAVTTPSLAVQELSENTPLNKKLKRPSVEPNNGTSKVVANKTLPPADIYDVVETDYEEPITRPKRSISTTKSNASFSSLGINRSKWRSLSSLHTPGPQIDATRKLAVTPNSNTERSIFQSLSVQPTNEVSGKRQVKRLPPESTSILNELDEKGTEREKAASKYQKQQDTGHLGRGKEGGLAAGKSSLKLARERAEAERKEAGKGEIETRDVKEIGAKVMAEAGENAFQEADWRGTGVIEPPTNNGGMFASWRKDSAKNTSLGAKKATCAPLTPRAKPSVHSLISLPTSQVIPNSSPVPVRDASPDIRRTSPKSVKRTISFASMVPSAARRSVSTTSSGSFGLKPAAPCPSFKDAKTPSKRVSPKPSSHRSPSRFSRGM